MFSIDVTSNGIERTASSLSHVRAWFVCARGSSDDVKFHRREYTTITVCARARSDYDHRLNCHKTRIPFYRCKHTRVMPGSRGATRRAQATRRRQVRLGRPSTRAERLRLTTRTSRTISSTTFASGDRSTRGLSLCLSLSLSLSRARSRALSLCMCVFASGDRSTRYGS